jgi:hypothetical protein
MRLLCWEFVFVTADTGFLGRSFGSSDTKAEGGGMLNQRNLDRPSFHQKTEIGTEQDSCWRMRETE